MKFRLRLVKYRDAPEKELLAERKFLVYYGILILVMTALPVFVVSFTNSRNLAMMAQGFALFAFGTATMALMQIYALAITFELRIREILKEKSPSQSTN